jgi:hypothetical protein
MTFRLSIAAVLLLGLAHPGAGQSTAPPPPAEANRNGSAPASVVPAVDVARLPIDIRRIEREFREASLREERSGLNLRYYVEVYGQAPPLVFLTKEDNLRYGPVPYGAPTHRDMLWMLTPPAHRGSLYALPLFRIPIGGSKKDK